ncbi:unnamed protein product [Litomosoides sigmodontis]|uniref:Uncharacterized protein n=1 Tax=Litomosoides sigmodontis TaxID=42156 RepID=A0A3P6SVQ3_LITSI|nr:unnamed protein product [Litomosoides sigmodontis]
MEKGKTTRLMMLPPFLLSFLLDELKKVLSVPLKPSLMQKSSFQLKKCEVQKGHRLPVKHAERCVCVFDAFCQPDNDRAEAVMPDS